MEIKESPLRVNYGRTEEECKDACIGWINAGGCYEYRSIRGMDTVEW